MIAIAADESFQPIVQEEVDVFEGLFPLAGICLLYTSQFTEAMGCANIGRGAFHSALKVKRKLCWSVWKSKCRYK